MRLGILGIVALVAAAVAGGSVLAGGVKKPLLPVVVTTDNSSYAAGQSVIAVIRTGPGAKCVADLSTQGQRYSKSVLILETADENGVLAFNFAVPKVTPSGPALLSIFCRKNRFLPGFGYATFGVGNST